MIKTIRTIRTFKTFRMNPNGSKSLNKKGFTIAELLIVVLIIGLITAFGINTYQVQREQFRFTESLTKVISLINTARNYAITSRAVYDPTKATPSFIPKEGYGIHMDKTTGELVLFANTGTDFDIYDVGDLIEETYTLPDISNLDSITRVLELEPDIGDEAVIIFRPPLAETFLGDNISDEPINELKFKFLRRGDDFEKIIKINSIAGFPEVE